MKKLIIPILIPSGIERRQGKTSALFTIWFQLNANHEIFDPGFTGPIPSTILKDIKSLPSVINKLKGKDIVITTNGEAAKLKARAVVNEVDIVSPEGMEFYKKYFGALITESKIIQASGSRFKFNNPSFPATNIIKSLFHYEKVLGPLKIDTPILERLALHNKKINHYNQLSEDIRAFAEATRKENERGRQQIMQQIRQVLDLPNSIDSLLSNQLNSTSGIDSLSSRQGVSFVGNIEQVDDFLSVAPAYVRKAFDALNENTYTQYLTGILTRIEIDFEELKAMFAINKELSLTISDFNEIDVNTLCIDPHEPLFPTCIRLITGNNNKYAVLLSTFSNTVKGSDNYFPYDDFFKNSILKSMIGKESFASPSLSNYEEVGKMFSERSALVKAAEMVKSHNDNLLKSSFDSLLNNMIKEVKSKRTGATKTASTSEQRLQASIDYLEYCHLKAKAAEELSSSIKAADEKLSAGLVLVHPNWHQLIKPERDEDCFKEHSLTKGYAVAVKTVEMPNFLSLTRRKEFLTIHGTDGKKVTRDDQNIRYGSISGDSLMNAMQRTDNVNQSATVYLSDNVLLTWMGGSLGLKNPNQGHEDDQNVNGDVENDVDLETQVLAQRVKRVFGVDFFPFLKRKEIEGKQLKDKFYFLNIGIDTKAQLPRLVFSNSKQYKFLFYTQYINGWQLPLRSDLSVGEDSPQLSLEEIIKIDEKQGEGEDLFAFKGLFTRNEHLKKVNLYYTEHIRDDQDKNKKGKEGESLKHLVIRTQKAGQIANETCSRHILPPESTLQMVQWHGRFRQGHMSINDIHQWHLKYHCRLHSDTQFKENGCVNKCQHFCGNHNMEEVYTNDFIFPNYLPDPLAAGFRLQFYRDANTSIPAKIYGYEDVICLFSKGRYPLVKSWRFVLKDGNISYRNWSKVVKDDANQIVSVYVPQGLELYVKISTIFSKEADDAVANKVLHGSEKTVVNNFMSEFSSLQSEDEFGNEMQKQSDMPYKYGYFESFPEILILTHAVKQPLMRPQIIDVKLKKFLPEDDTNRATGKGRARTSVEAILELRFEMLNVIRCFLNDNPVDYFTYINKTQPTGDLELWGKWEDFIDNPHISYKPSNTDDLDRLRSLRTPKLPQIPLNDEKNNFKFLGKVMFEEVAKMDSIMHLALEKVRTGSELDFTIFKTKVTVDFDIEKTQATSIVFQIRNSSKWNGFYTPEEASSKYPFQLISNEFKRILPSNPAQIKNETKYILRNGVIKEAVSNYYLNNQKPQKPIISRIIPLVITDSTRLKNKGKDFTRQITRYNRFRVFLKRDKDSLLTASNQERAAFILKTSKAYGDYFLANEYVSRVGTDWITDTQKIEGDETYLTINNFNCGQSELEEDYVKKNDPKPFADAFMDLVHYNFQFDAFRNNWYFDFEIDCIDEKAGEYHNAFLQLALVNFYEPGHNYSNPTDKDPSKDFRLSEIEMTNFITLLPSRAITARIYQPSLFRKHGCVEFSLECNLSSLFFDKKGMLRSQLYAGIRETYRDTRQFIQSAMSLETQEQKQGKDTCLFHRLLNHTTKSKFEIVEGNKIAANFVKLEFDRKGIFGHKYELVIVEMENYLPDHPVDCNSPEFFKLPGQRIKYVEIF